jgi:hypothetical protein
LLSLLALEISSHPESTNTRPRRLTAAVRRNFLNHLCGRFDLRGPKLVSHI